MPENETLAFDATSANRWGPIRDGLDQGLSIGEVFPDIQDQFYRSCQRVWRQLKNCGVDPGELFEAAVGDPRRLAELIRQTRNDPSARLLRDIATSLPDATRDVLMRRFLLALFDDLRPYLRLDCREDARHPVYTKLVYRRQAMLIAGIVEPKDAYAVDLFAPPDHRHPIPAKTLQAVRAFHQQIGSLYELDDGIIPECLHRYLHATRAISSDEELAQLVEVHRRYRREWLALIADAQRRKLPWVAPALYVHGAAS